MKVKNILQILKKLDLKTKEYSLYGDCCAKINIAVTDRLKHKKEGKLIFVTSINPTPHGEGKTTTSIGLLDALCALNKKTTLCLRQPSLGPVFGVKGGAAGGGKSRLHPFENINLHFTGDSHAVAYAHNILAAVVDNHIYWGNRLGIDKDRILINRVIDINDRSLRKIKTGLAFNNEATMRLSSFSITAASEIMAILALSKNERDLEKMLDNVIVAYNKEGDFVYAKDLKVISGLHMLLQDALKPNLIQSYCGNPVLMHTGPFGNIAHGNSSLIATKIALGLSDYVITEGGFGSDLGLEKFINIVARKAGFEVDCVVIVVSLRALKYHSGLGDKDDITDISDLKNGLQNLEHHVNIVKSFGLKSVVCINRFAFDKDKDILSLSKYCQNFLMTDVAVSEVFQKGAAGGMDLAGKVLARIKEKQSKQKQSYPLNIDLKEKINIIAKNIYGASDVGYTKSCVSKLKYLKEKGFNHLPVNIAKTQFSLTHDRKVLGFPRDWNLELSDIMIANGAGFVIAIAGKMLLLPGLPEHSLLEDVEYKNSKYRGLF